MEYVLECIKVLQVFADVKYGFRSSDFVISVKTAKEIFFFFFNIEFWIFMKMKFLQAKLDFSTKIKILGNTKTNVFHVESLINIFTV